MKDNQNYSYSEDRLNNVKKRKKNKLHAALVLLGYLAVLILIMLVVSLLMTWIDDKMRDSAIDMAVAVGAEPLPEDKEVTMTQAELNTMLEEAAAKAVMENAVSSQAAADSARAEVLEDIQARLETGDESMVEVLRPFYPNDIVVVSSGKFYFVPINQNLKMNSYSEDNLNILESGEYQYLENGEVISHKGIDVSSHQGEIDWQAVAADGVEFAMIRAAYRGYGSEGKLVEDKNFEDNIEGALAAGIHVGVYLYSQAITEEEVKEEAELVLQKLAPYGVKCPIVFDVEKTASDSGRMNQITLEERTNLALLFCQTVENAGYKPIIYHNMEMGALMVDLETLEGYDKWFAYYNGDMYYPYDYQIWQYSDKGTVNGIKTEVDLNISFSPFWEE